MKSISSLTAARNWIPAFAGITPVFGLLFLLSACAAFAPPRASMPSREGIVPGETITVQSSQNVYRVARDHNVPMRDLIVLNNLQPPFTLRIGQKLVLPAGYRGDADQGPAPMPAPSTASVGVVEETSLAPIQPAPLPPVTTHSTQYSNTPKAAALVTPATEAQAFTTPSALKSSPTTASPKKLPPPQQLAEISPAEAAPPPDAPSIAFVWPVQGPVLSGYGPKGQGLNNDGVNIGAPKSSPVVAAASGIVVYAGNEMKGFGNLVLIRHQGGWVTAYAHLERVLVNKDAVVAQGDMIGTVGKSGNVASPQLHFETRYQGKPVDPNGVIKG